ncbi:molybdopterin molybdenumtransferase [bacterium BMS3Abin02]|nr:molybdopterin molybdenumtransferase [bacterium BMS3Abin02]GBE23144.1 molybdopterin molybdenumtransferase [bacterium BMS3Bbin01]HDH26635.1 molybdopterin molybdenumtransferase MoeA [Actinomycetota bacterium]HDL49170.1 molybdopterin molybdenumtransferase MoeA [Actinomycetota bacterium]
MKPRREAQREVLTAVGRIDSVRVPLAEARGLVLAEPVDAPHDVPPFPNSAMDGYAIRAADLEGIPVELRVIEDVPAGSVPTHTVEPGAAIKIMTGAPMPAGADTVVEVEVTEPGDRSVMVLASRAPGSNVRPAGGDMEAGARVFEAGERLTPAHLGVLASIGVIEPLVRRRPVAAVLSTGDELLPPEVVAPTPGKIRDANRTALIALLADLGVGAIDFGIVGDDAVALRATLEEAAGTADAVITSGGVSMGEYDLVKAVLADLGTVAFWKVAQQPGKPFAFGQIEGTPLFGLPGNPVSVIVSFEQFVRPALLHMMGATALFRPQILGRITTAVSTNPARDVFLRVCTRIEGDGLLADLAGGQSSNVLSAMAHADAFALVPVGVGDLEAGDTVTLEMFRWPEIRTMEVLDG